MSTVQLPLWTDADHWESGVKRHPRLAKRLEKLTAEIDSCEDQEEYYELVQERQVLFDRIVS
jgi:hypothetical protein